ncbi:MAG TPA: M48 family metalloprotease, partial [Gaiellaceae bacterium]|nr:M48 family metalloprotease [Gaiellaceae bacterium]
MTARRRGALHAVVLAGVAATYAVAVYFLAQTSVPSGLDLPAVDVEEAFGAAVVEEARDFERVTRWLFVLGEVTVLAVLGFYAWFGPRLTRESAAGRIGTGMLLGMLGLGILWFAQVPVGLLDLWWQRRHDLVETGYAEWILGSWLALGGEFLFICLALLIVMALAGRLRDRWWIVGGPVFVGLVALFAFVLPYLTPGLEPAGRALRSEARVYAERQDTEPVPVDVESVREVTSAPNAAAMGLGPTKRIVLWDSLLDGRFSDGEVSVVLAHEVGHHARNHIAKSIAWYALFAIPGAFVIASLTKRRGGMARPEAVPLGLFVLVALSLLALPLQNVITRHLEREADWQALGATEDPAAAEGLFERFAVTSLGDPSPPTWAYILMDTHPTLAQRVSMA